MPKVSIVLPVYNSARYLRACLDSIIAQTHHEFELICIDDGSSDGSDAILKDYAARDSRVGYYHQENSGVYVARNWALDLAQGEFLYFMDADDALEPQMLEILVSSMTQTKADVAYFSWKFPREETNEVPMSTFDVSKVKPEVFEDGLDATLGHRLSTAGMLWFKMFRASFVAGLRFPDGFKYKDLSYTWYVLSRRPRVVRVDEALYHYTENPDSLIGGHPKPEHFKEMCDAVPFAYDYLVERGMIEEAQRFLRLQGYLTLKYLLWFISQARPEDEAQLSLALANHLRDYKNRSYIGWSCLIPRDFYFVYKVGGNSGYALKHYLRSIRDYFRAVRLMRRHR